jgi:3-hydroxyisobutyrate dehydrogenase
MAKVAWIGAGLLGSGFVEAMQARGDSVRVWNRTEKKARALEKTGATVAHSPGEAAHGADRVHLCLSDDAAVDAVLALLEGHLRDGTPIIDHTTVSPGGARARQAHLSGRGVPFLACPVFMAPANARAGNGLMLCAGERDVIEAHLPALRAMTGNVLVYGADAGVPATIKLVGNALIIGLSGALSDALTVAHRSGVSPSDAMQLFTQFNIANALTGRGQRMAAGDYAPSFELAMAHKDVSLMIEAAGDLPLAVMPGLAQRMAALMARGHGQDDLAVLACDVIPKKPA